jgi:rhodanese-related sulfurtransferase
VQHNPGFIRLVEVAKQNIQEVSPLEAAKLNKEGAILIDVREESEWLAGHATGAIHLGKGIIERDIENRVPDLGRTLLCYCGGGYRSALVADNLKKMGYSQVYSVAGGWRAWQDARLPTTTAPENCPRSPSEKLEGIYHLARLIDKCRLCPAGKLPGYNYLTIGFDKMLLEFLCIDGKLLEQCVAQSTSDAEVVNWIKMKLGPGWPSDSLISEFNEKLEKLHPTTPDRIEWFNKQRALCPPTRHRIVTYFDLIELEEGRFQDQTGTQV